MSTRIDEWMRSENTVVKSYEQLQAENEDTRSTLEYNEKIVHPWMEQNQMENELRKKLGAPPNWATDKEKIEFHRRQLALLEKANMAPRCEHIFSDGRRCRAPRVRKGQHCYAHMQMQARRPQRMNLPPLEDANAVALWLMEVSRGLLDGQISERTAGLLFYGLQLAMVNARWTTFTETDPAEMVRKAPEEFTAADAKGAKELGLEKRQDFTAENAEVAEKHKLGMGAGQRIVEATRSPEEFTAGLVRHESSQMGTKLEKRRDFTAENAEVAEKHKLGMGAGQRLVEATGSSEEFTAGLVPHESSQMGTKNEEIAGVESNKSFVFGDVGEGVGSLGAPISHVIAVIGQTEGRPREAANNE